jgi:hypothetical protein
MRSAQLTPSCRHFNKPGRCLACCNLGRAVGTNLELTDAGACVRVVHECVTTGRLALLC